MTHDIPGFPENYVYLMSCGHTWDSPFRRHRNAFIICAEHGEVTLMEGDFL